MGNFSIPRRAGAFLVLLVLFSFFSVPLFAQAAITQLQGVADTIKGILTGNLVRTIVVIALIGSFIAFAVNKDNQRVRANSIAVGISAVVIGTAGLIIDLIWITN